MTTTEQVPADLRVVIAVLTYKRPLDLPQALAGLVAQAATVNPPADILLVDNDPDAGAADEGRRWADRGVRYVHEPRPGIAAARNRALRESDGYDVLVFIDDDERPTPHWLADLVATYRTDRPAGVVGPVVSEFAREPDSWVAAGRFFDRRRLPTGTVVDVAATNNLLLDLGTLRKHGIEFDERFGLSGGSDTLFTRQLTRAGGRLVWCDEAVVVDVVPDARLTRAWVLRRAYRSGNGWSRTSLVLAATEAQRLRARAELSARGALRVGGGVARYAAGVVRRSQGLRARGVRTMARGAGLVSGAWGSTYSEYRRG